MCYSAGLGSGGCTRVLHTRDERACRGLAALAAQGVCAASQGASFGEKFGRENPREKARENVRENASEKRRENAREKFS